jgi:hypothetical protein
VISSLSTYRGSQEREGENVFLSTATMTISNKSNNSNNNNRGNTRGFPLLRNRLRSGLYLTLEVDCRPVILSSTNKSAAEISPLSIPTPTTSTVTE